MAMSELETMGGSPNPRLQQIQNNYVAAIATVDQIAAALGLTQNKDLGAILEAIADLKDKATKAVECTQFGIEVLKEKVELINVIAVELNLSGDFEDADVLRQVKAERQAKECAMLAARERGEALDAIANQLGFNTFHAEQVSGWIKNLQGKAAIIDYTDFTELRSERDYYRGILDKLCDRLKVVDIEALEHVVKHQEMSIDFTLQHNDDLQEKFIAAKVMASKRLSRIVELEDELRSLQEPVNIGCGDDHVDSLRYFVDAFKPNALKNFDSDRLTTPELIQIIRSLLK
jgi:hypothetical protein